MKKSLIWLLVVVFILPMIFIGTGCKEEAPAEEEKGLVYILIPYIESTYFILGMETMDKILKEYGYDTKLLSTASDLNEQIEQLDTAIAINPEAIILSPVDSWGIVEAAEKVQEAGITLIAWERAITTNVPITILCDNVKIGEIGGEQAVELLIEKNEEPEGLVLEITGDLGDAVAHEFGEGIHNILDSYPDIEVITKTSEGWTTENAVAILEDVLLVNPDIDLILAHLGFWGPGMITVLEKYGYGPREGDKPHMPFVSLAGEPIALDLVREGWIDGESDQPVTKTAKICAEITDMLIKGKEINIGDTIKVTGIEETITILESEYGPLITAPPSKITSENVDNPEFWGNYRPEEE